MARIIMSILHSIPDAVSAQHTCRKPWEMLNFCSEHIITVAVEVITCIRL